MLLERPKCPIMMTSLYLTPRQLLFAPPPLCDVSHQQHGLQLKSWWGCTSLLCSDSENVLEANQVLRLNMATSYLDACMFVYTLLCSVSSVWTDDV